MTDYETAQLEFAALLFAAAAVPLAAVARVAVRRWRWPAQPTACAALILALCCAAWALADGEGGKPVPPQVARYMRLRAEWVRWTHAVRAEWAEAVAAVQQGFISVSGLYGDVLAITNGIPTDAVAPRVMRLRPNLVANSANDNFKSRPMALQDNGDGTWTVEVRHSRIVEDAPALMMYLRRRRDGASWWVEHESTSFPTNSAPLSYTYTFRMPVGVSGYLAVADEILLGGPDGLRIEGVVVVNPDAGKMYEGVSGTYILGGRTVWIKGGQFLSEPSSSATAGEPPELLAAPAPMMMMMRGARFAAPEPPAPRAIKLAMPPLDGGAP